ncbi:MAG TPA: NAD-dependent epimerase/dehydratase family protein [Dietzia timorensis]|uniref:NAD-dependent epimerase/dehydratase family protein n=1 Tax=Dietzia timorensis TaxID=499555 RepID=A0A921F1H0_9ACTN|nr:NAD-dependent epimerase/dehydratase family protein [Dietzia timorensis]HJE90071.1 NAD-dependent epimerase/dehydratase family protein [Dietzia timorensis]
MSVATSTQPSGDEHVVKAVAVIGGSRYLGAHLVGALLREPTIERVIAIDSSKPSAQFRRRMGNAEFVRLDPQSPRMQAVLREKDVDTIVHAGLHHNDFAPGGRAAVKESNIMGSMHMMAAAGRAASVKRFVLLSSTSVYGSSMLDPAMFSEDMAAKRSPGGGIPRDYLSVEGYARGMNRKRPDIEVSILRVPAILGLPEPTVFGELLQPSITPVLGGFDPRIQLLHPQDALEALVLATMRGPGGTFNIAGDGMITLSQAVRRAGHIAIPVLPPFFRVAAGIFTGEGLKKIGSSQIEYLKYGRGVDNRRMREVFGFSPRYSTSQALAAYIKDSGIEPVLSADTARAAVRAMLAAVPRSMHPAILASVESVLAEIDRPATGAKTRNQSTLRAMTVTEIEEAGHGHDTPATRNTQAGQRAKPVASGSPKPAAPGDAARAAVASKSPEDDAAKPAKKAPAKKPPAKKAPPKKASPPARTSGAKPAAAQSAASRTSAAAAEAKEA